MSAGFSCASLAFATKSDDDSSVILVGMARTKAPRSSADAGNSDGQTPSRARPPPREACRAGNIVTGPTCRLASAGGGRCSSLIAARRIRTRRTIRTAVPRGSRCPGDRNVLRHVAACRCPATPEPRWAPTRCRRFHQRDVARCQRLACVVLRSGRDPAGRIVRRRTLPRPRGVVSFRRNHPLPTATRAAVEGNPWPVRSKP